MFKNLFLFSFLSLIVSACDAFNSRGLDPQVFLPITEPDSGQLGKLDQAKNPEILDPLTMPKEATLDPTHFTSTHKCAECHQQHTQEWRSSMHSYAMVDPVYQALIKLRHDEFDGKQDRFCLQCHSAIGTRGGEIKPGFEFKNLSPIVMEGVTCVACHQVTEVVAGKNAGHKLDSQAAMVGSLENPIEGGFHQNRNDKTIAKSNFCGSCHDVKEVNGLPLERAYEEFMDSPSDAKAQQCQDCHMPKYSGMSAVGGKIRDNLHNHHFIGVALPLNNEFYKDGITREDIKSRIQTLLDQAADLEITVPQSIQAGRQLDLYATIHNKIEGHNLPTGTTFIRELWLELTVSNDEGMIVYKTGDLDENGDLKGPFSAIAPYGDKDLIQIGSYFLDARGEPNILSWHAEEHISNTISPLYSRTYTFFIPIPEDIEGQLHISAKLKFRNFAPHLLRALKLEKYIESLEIFDLAVITKNITVTE